MKVTREMLGVAHDIMLARGDFVLSAALLEKIYEAMRNKEPMENREAVERDALRYRKLCNSERFAVDEKCVDGHWEPLGQDLLDDALDEELNK